MTDIKAKANAGPSAALRFAQDDGILLNFRMMALGRLSLRSGLRLFWAFVERGGDLFGADFVGADLDEDVFFAFGYCFGDVGVGYVGFEEWGRGAAGDYTDLVACFV
jgi:hypothetical protein